MARGARVSCQESAPARRALASRVAEGHFARAFRRFVRLTPRQFVEQRRVERARQLIRHSRHSLAEIAVESGLGTQSRLTTAFTRQTGFTPARYRRGAERLEEVAQRRSLEAMTGA